MHSNPLGPLGKKLLLLKTRKSARYFGAYTNAKKCVACSQLR